MRSRLDRFKIFRQSRLRRRRRPMIRLVFLIIMIISVPAVTVYFVISPKKDDVANTSTAATPTSQQISEALDIADTKSNENLAKCNKNHITNLETYVDNKEVSVEKVLTPEKDEQAPEITLNGANSQMLVIGSNYDEQGATATDNCDEVTIETLGEVNTNVAGVYTITYRSTDKSGNVAEKTRTVKIVNPAAGDSVIYLTFDDGPSAYTGALLDILKKYGIKATFFVTGYGDDALIAREYNEGHTVGVHSFSHRYDYIYTSAANYFDDLNKIQTRVGNITGETPMLVRFPGGSSNLISRRYDGGAHIMSYLTQELTNRGFVYFDWNVLSGDAGETTDADQVYANVVNNLKPGGASVVLQHDTKDFSVAAVERIIQYGLNNGYAFAKLDASSFTAHHGVTN